MDNLLNQENLNRDFKGVWIPKEIWLNKELTILDKVILIEIDSLDNEKTHCIAGNNYLANFCNCTETKVSTSISKLKKLGYIEQVSFDGRSRILKSRLKKSEGQPLKNLKADFKKIKSINIDNNINKEEINKDNKLSLLKNGKINNFIKPTLEEVKSYCLERNNGVDAEYFIDYYETIGWKVGKNNMKDWKACVRTWERRTDKKVEKDPSKMTKEEQKAYYRSLGYIYE